MIKITATSLFIKVVKCLNEWTEEAVKIHQHSPLRKKKSTWNCHMDKNVSGNLRKLEGNKCIASRAVACHCIPLIATHPFKFNGSGRKKITGISRRSFQNCHCFLCCCVYWYCLVHCDRERLLEYQMCSQERQEEREDTLKFSAISSLMVALIFLTSGSAQPGTSW